MSNRFALQIFAPGADAEGTAQAHAEALLPAWEVRFSLFVNLTSQLPLDAELVAQAGTALARPRRMYAHFPSSVYGVLSLALQGALDLTADARGRLTLSQTATVRFTLSHCLEGDPLLELEFRGFDGRVGEVQAVRAEQAHAGAHSEAAGSSVRTGEWSCVRGKGQCHENCYANEHLGRCSEACFEHMHVVDTPYRIVYLEQHAG